MAHNVAVDMGGTFTDLIATDGDAGLQVAKSLTTPATPSQGIFEALAKAEIDPAAIEYFVHGTTVGTNMLIERRGPRIGLITTQGFRDVLRIQRIVRPESFDLHWRKPRHLVDRALSLEVRERIGAHGEVVQALIEKDVVAAVERLRAEDVKAIAVSYLFSFLNPEHERRTREIVHELYPEAYVSISSDVFPQWREFERTSTTVIDAYLKPRIDEYLTSLEDELHRRGARGLLIMRSNGGVMATATAKAQPVTMIQSGPAGGVIGSLQLGQDLGLDPLMTADIGGTSFDACLVAGGRAAQTTTTELEFGIPIATPMLDIRSIGAGGGSIAWLDAAGLLKVGPQSAGADPGPASYGRGGGEPTSTDANVVLGRLDPAFKLGGDVQLVPEAARTAVERIGSQLGFSAERAAAGILEIMNSNMAETMRLLTIDQGIDPREFTLVAFGGAGPLHGAYLADHLGMQRVVVPPFPGAFSALGALMADTRFDYMQTRITYSENIDVETVQSDFDDLEQRARDDFAREGFGDPPAMQRSLDLRYYGQNWELEVPVAGGAITAADIAAAREAFDAEHDRQFGWSFPESAFEIVNMRLTAIARRREVHLPDIPPGPMPTPVKVGEVYFTEADGLLSTPFYHRDDLRAGNAFTGPAMIVEDDATAIVPPGWSARVEPRGSIILEVG